MSPWWIELVSLLSKTDFVWDWLKIKQVLGRKCGPYIPSIVSRCQYDATRNYDLTIMQLTGEFL
jgi:hypothetical protein